jgi:deazaflavin-dependent nitroreductase family protein
VTTSNKRRAMGVMWKLHRFWYRVSGGRIGRKVAGLPVLRLTTTGRSSGKARDVMLTYLDDPRGFVVIASNAGDQRDPAWWRNLQADPHASVRVGRKGYSVRMRQLEGDEREQAWQRVVAAFDGYATYAASTSRTIPVAVLDKGQVDQFTGRITWES